MTSDQPECDLPASPGWPPQRVFAAAANVRLEQLPTIRESELCRLHGMGPKALEQLCAALAANSLSFADEERT